MYKVIEFDDGILAVPTKWIDEKNQVCKWPPYLNDDIEKAIQDAEDVKNNWIELPIMAEYGKAVDDLAIAKERVKYAQMVSDIDDDEKLKKSRHERKRKILSSDSESEEGDTIKRIEEKAMSKSLKFPTKLPKNIIKLARFPNEKGKKDKDENLIKRSTIIFRGSNQVSSDSAEMLIQEESHVLADIGNIPGCNTKLNTVDIDKQRANTKSSVTTSQLEPTAKNQQESHYKFLTMDEKLNYIIGTHYIECQNSSSKPSKKRKLENILEAFILDLKSNREQNKEERKKVQLEKEEKKEQRWETYRAEKKKMHKETSEIQRSLVHLLGKLVENIKK